ncbi:hypothetical protein HYPSUDRAFT_204932 [Hypholoma sublateritium FD-334 SS-4]|uniref:Uncharacterized protein n=1 Tax=Hypholoma sublateritium (strain FD-334 SS-4) TaxID=945553 RepID=A0A0D2PFX6_HYPSF|nr:hypothetical protein HYPSUDRAFT_204932 [Hypholoma sublateritium FD-334 SS-4]
MSAFALEKRSAAHPGVRTGKTRTVRSVLEHETDVDALRDGTGAGSRSQNRIAPGGAHSASPSPSRLRNVAGAQRNRYRSASLRVGAARQRLTAHSALEHARGGGATRLAERALQRVVQAAASDEVHRAIGAHKGTREEARVLLECYAHAFYAC